VGLSEELVVRYILQLTEETARALQWRELEAGGFRAELNGVSIEFQQPPSREGSYICLLLKCNTHVIVVQEPRCTSVFASRCQLGDLSYNMHSLLRAVAGQCEARPVSKEQHRDEIREFVFRRLMFGSEA